MWGDFKQFMSLYLFFTRQKRVLDLTFQESFAVIQISSETDLFYFNLSIIGSN